MLVLINNVIFINKSGYNQLLHRILASPTSSHKIEWNIKPYMKHSNVYLFKLNFFYLLSSYAASEFNHRPNSYQRIRLHFKVPKNLTSSLSSNSTLRLYVHPHLDLSVVPAPNKHRTLSLDLVHINFVFVICNILGDYTYYKP